VDSALLAVDVGRLRALRAAADRGGRRQPAAALRAPVMPQVRRFAMCSVFSPSAVRQDKRASNSCRTRFLLASFDAAGSLLGRPRYDGQAAILLYDGCDHLSSYQLMPGCVGYDAKQHTCSFHP